MAGDDGVLHERIGRGNELHAHQADVDPGPGRELEILDHAAVEYDALGGVGGIGELDRITDAVEAFLVERGGSEVGPLVIPRRHVGAAHPDFELVAGGYELELAARHRQADYAG